MCQAVSMDGSTVPNFKSLTISGEWKFVATLESMSLKKGLPCELGIGELRVAVIGVFAPLGDRGVSDRKGLSGVQLGLSGRSGRRFD